jgi:hypothetical protein
LSSGSNNRDGEEQRTSKDSRHLVIDKRTIAYLPAATVSQDGIVLPSTNAICRTCCINSSN